MTIIETVKRAITNVPGNAQFRAIQLVDVCPDPRFESGNVFMSGDQIKRALRELPNVKRVGNGRYLVKGRKVPARN